MRVNGGPMAVIITEERVGKGVGVGAEIRTILLCLFTPCDRKHDPRSRECVDTYVEGIRYLIIWQTYSYLYVQEPVCEHKFP